MPRPYLHLSQNHRLNQSPAPTLLWRKRVRLPSWTTKSSHTWVNRQHETIQIKCLLPSKPTSSKWDLKKRFAYWVFNMFWHLRRGQLSVQVIETLLPTMDTFQIQRLVLGLKTLRRRTWQISSAKWLLELNGYGTCFFHLQQVKVSASIARCIYTLIWSEEVTAKMCLKVNCYSKIRFPKRQTMHP